MAWVLNFEKSVETLALIWEIWTELIFYSWMILNYLTKPEFSFYRVSSFELCKTVSSQHRCNNSNWTFNKFSAVEFDFNLSTKLKEQWKADWKSQVKYNHDNCLWYECFN